jgi:hypothetical protein
MARFTPGQFYYGEIAEEKGRCSLNFGDQYGPVNLNPLGGCSQGAFALDLNV